MSLRVKNTGSSGGANLIIDGVKQTEDTSLISIMEPGGSISVSTLSYDFYCGCAVVYNNELHILGGGSSSYQRYHYKWNGTSWVSVSTLPYNLYKGSAVVYNNEIHIQPRKVLPHLQRVFPHGRAARGFLGQDVYSHNGSDNLSV